MERFFFKLQNIGDESPIGTKLMFFFFCSRYVDAFSLDRVGTISSMLINCCIKLLSDQELHECIYEFFSPASKPLSLWSVCRTWPA